MPSATRPQRPLRWSALACEMGSMGRRWTLVRVAVAGDAGGAGVDDVADAGDGERGLGDVGGEHDAAAARSGWRELEDAVLLGGGQAAVEGEDLEVLGGALQGVGGLADLALAGEEDEDVAGAVRR